MKMTEQEQREKIIEKVRTLNLEEQKKVLAYIEKLEKEYQDK